MTARLRILPISTREEGQPTHYVVLDRADALASDRTVLQLREATEEARGVPLVFAGEVDIPEVDVEELEETPPGASTVITVSLDGDACGAADTLRALRAAGMGRGLRS